MAQFDHPELGGSVQWMRGGMTMVSDLFNHQLKARVDALCSELATLLAREPSLTATATATSSQSQSQSQSPHHHGGSVSLFVAPHKPEKGSSAGWWKADLGTPGSVGSQNDVRYAYFPSARRLAIEVHGRVTIYDTLDHQIGGFSQAQSHGASLSFSSQHGVVDVERLPVVSGDDAAQPAAQPAAPAATPAAATPAAAATPVATATPPRETGDVFATIEKLAALRDKGILTEEEFAAKKAELLGRL
jgi:hypothetical protein